ncbi:Dyslexia susceptibility 1 candidate gene 1 protein-like [Oopsacas minuta]|uniref:Dyslexia susceptibility 1 candidate gene 1 protein-like n=1 Tax=Oopsacas minuta TaxID=111878 RepID=A0AAV7KJM6_9METZ|nr:Dyslexia susceptibility 1 candidate gene 1 protein-like [Oopsacas minuta]
MPILVDKDSHWTETDEYIQLILPLKGTAPQNVDVFCTTEYLKVSYPPYLFEALLKHKIDTLLSKIIVANGFIQINLKKIESELWMEFKSELGKDKAIMQRKREEALVEAQKRCENSVAERRSIIDRQKKQGVTEQMDLESGVRQKIENAKNKERKLATKALEELQEENQNKISDLAQKCVKNISHKKSVTFEQKSEEPLQKDKKIRKVAQQRISNSEIFQTGTVKAPIRKLGIIQCQFTPRVFPTPERESKKIEEEEWLAKLAEARRNPKMEPSTEPELNNYQNTNPQWLKDRGDQLYKNGDYESSYNVYTQAVELKTKLPSVYANRALCLLKMARFRECISDCDEAITLLVPVIEANRRQRANVFARRGAANMKLELYQEAVGDYKMAAQLCPDMESLKVDKEKLEILLAERENKDRR